MSIDYHAYCGPFLLCKTTLVEEMQPRGSKRCVHCMKQPDTFAHLMPGVKFCPLCGNALEPTMARVLTDSVNPHEAMDAIGHALTSPDSVAGCERGTHIYLPNQTARAPGEEPGSTARAFSVDPKHEEAFAVITPQMVESEQLGFAHRYAEAIGKLQGIYRELGVQIAWGWLVWSD